MPSIAIVKFLFVGAPKASS